MWPCTVLIAKSHNRSVITQLRIQLSLSLIQEKYFPATVLPTRMACSIWSSWLFKQNMAKVNDFLASYKVISIWFIYHGSMLELAKNNLIYLSNIGRAWTSYLIMVDDEHVKFIMFPLFLTEWGFVSFQQMQYQRNGECTDLFQHSIPSGGMLFQFICFSQDCDRLFLISTSLAKITVSDYANRNSSLAFSRVSLLLCIFF